MTKRLDQKLIDAWCSLPEKTQAAIKRALANPGPLGAVVSASSQSERNVKTPLGFAVHSGFVTPLGRALVEAVDGAGESAAPKRKRAAKAASA